jgi:hypothetical protein
MIFSHLTSNPPHYTLPGQRARDLMLEPDPLSGPSVSIKKKEAGDRGKGPRGYGNDNEH